MENFNQTAYTAGYEAAEAKSAQVDRETVRELAIEIGRRRAAEPFGTAFYSFLTGALTYLNRRSGGN